MEVVVIVGVVAAIFVIIRLGISDNKSKPAQPRSSPRPPSPISPPEKIRPVRPSSFNAANAEHLSHKRILTGAAYITDGDTIKIKNTQIRLFGIDAPEMNHPYGKKAKWALHSLCKGQIVKAEIVDEDDHGRTVAHCSLPDGRDLSAGMVKQGLAIDWPKFSGGKYRNMGTSDARKKLFLADARQKGRMHVWEKFDAQERKR